MADGDGSPSATGEPSLEPLLEDSAEDLYENAPCGYLSTLPDGTILKLNETFLSWTGHRRDDLVGRKRLQDLLTPGGRIFHETHYAPLLRMQGEVREIAVEIVCAGGRRLPVLMNSVLRSDEDGRPVLARTTVFNATDRKEYERELLRARERERDARERIERLQRITVLLAATLHADRIGAAVTGELVRAIAADQALLILDGAEDEPLEVVVSHGCSEEEVAVWRDRARDAGLPIGMALASGEPVFAGREELPGALAGLAALAVLPLVAAGRTVGVLCLGFTAPHPFAEEERAFLVTCAGQCAQALERARLYARERNVARILQQSLLAGDPPEDPRFAVATRYLPAVEALEVGGDWHDVFAIDEDTIGVAVGDVVGRGLEAASTMGQLRSASRALAGTRIGPARLIERLDWFVERLESARMATLAYAEVALDSGRLRFACAGHPPPVLAATDVPPRALWEGRSRPLGAYIGAAGVRAEAELTLEPGARLLLYTDGLVERRDLPLDRGLGLLLAELGRRPGEGLGPLLTGLTDAMLVDGRSEDDVCLLCLSYFGP